MGGAMWCNVYLALTPPGQMLDGGYTGSLTVANSSSPVTMRVVSPPYAVPSTSQIDLQLAQGAPAMAYPFLPAITLGNQQNTLVPQSVTVSGDGVRAYVSGSQVVVSVDPGSLAPGSYPDAGSVTIQCNAVNCPLRIPVGLTIVASGPPVIANQGVVDNATSSPASEAAQGDVMVVKGQQLSLSAPTYASAGALPTLLGDASVLVNGVAAPLFYSSYGQIAFQLPAATPLGAAQVRVRRGGQTSDATSIAVDKRAPGIVAITDIFYNVLDLAHPAKAGDTVVVWAIGQGATDPAVADGMPAPASPLPAVVSAPTVQVGGHSAIPLYAVMSPGSVGLYQVALTLPAGLPSNTWVKLVFPEVSSNTASLAIE